MPGLMELLGYAGNALDLPASSLRDLLTGNNPFDQWMTPFSSDNRTSGRDMLNPIFGANKETGMAGWLDDPMEGVADVLGFGAEMVLDPLNAISGAGVMRALKGRKAAKSANKVIAAENAANAGKYGYVNPKVLSRTEGMVNPVTQQVPHWQDQVAKLETDRLNLVGQADDEGMGTASIFQDLFGETPDTLAQLDRAGLRQQYDELGKRIDEIRSQNPMKLLGYTPERPTVYHGGHDWTASATPEHPYGVFDVSRLKTGEGANAYGPGAYFGEAENTAERYLDLVKDKLKRVDPITDLKREIVRRSNPASRNPLVSSMAAEPPEAVRGIVSLLEGSNWLGADVKTLRGRDKLEEMLYDGIGLDGNPIPAEVKAAFDQLESSTAKARLYQLDMPHEAADRFVLWNNPMNQQPVGIQDAVRQRVPGFDDLATEYVGVWDKLGQAKTEMRKLKTYDPDYLDRPEGMRWLAAASQARNAQKSIVDDVMRQTGLGRYDAQKLLENPDELMGESVAQVLLGGSPQSVPVANATALPQLGVSGTKNLAASTGRNTYNYAIWDQDLLNQMRIRAIDGQRVPINPTTLVQQVAQPLPQVADPALIQSMNPMRPLQQLPGVAAPAAASAVYNFLARQNNYGGVM